MKLKRIIRLKKIGLFDIIIWIAIIFWCGFIFFMSCEKADESNDTSGGVCNYIATIFIDDYGEMSEFQKEGIIEDMQFFVRKTAHFTAYAVLGGLIALALRRLNFKKRFVISLAGSFIYACSDEIHQLFVAGRSGQIRDVLIDSCGAITGILLVCLVLYIVNKSKSAKVGSI